MPIKVMRFTELEREILKTGKSVFDHLATDFGKVYVLAITRDGCPACEKQKARLSELAITLAKKYGNKVIFIRVHIGYLEGSEEESLRSKDVFRHYFYPTNLILFRTRVRGAIEYYRNVSPDMDELKKNIETAVEIATMIEKEMT